MGKFIQDLMKGTPSSSMWYNFRVQMLPEGSCAAGIRAGAANRLVSSMPEDIVVYVTGHEKKKSNALWEYVDVNPTKCQPGATVLAGFPPFAWGTMGKGPEAPSLSSLQVCGCVLARACMRAVCVSVLCVHTH